MACIRGGVNESSPLTVMSGAPHEWCDKAFTQAYHYYKYPDNRSYWQRNNRSRCRTDIASKCNKHNCNSTALLLSLCRGQFYENFRCEHNAAFGKYGSDVYYKLCGIDGISERRCAA